MISQAQIKLLKSLQQKKFREEMHLFIAEGKKIIDELLDSPPSERFIRAGIEVVHVYTSGTYFGNTPFTKVTDAEIKKISSLTNPQNIIALCRIPPENSVIPDLNKELVLVLDDIRDPGNMGTIIRIADWFGINYIFCTEECVDVYNPKVVQASMGSIARVNIDYKNLRNLLKESTDNQIPVYGASLEGSNILNEQLTPNGLLIIGNESTGISEELKKYITKSVKIPSYHTETSSAQVLPEKAKGAESLNAAVATAIICSEFRRSALTSLPPQ